LDLTIAMIYIIVLGNVAVVPIVLIFSAQLAKVSIVPPQVLAPFVIGITTVSAFMANVTIEDLALVGVFAVLGMFMKAYGWPRPPILIAIVLTSQLEKWMSIAVQTRGWSMIWQPAFLVILVMVGLAVFFSLRVAKGSDRVAEKTEQEIAEMNATTETSSGA